LPELPEFFRNGIAGNFGVHFGGRFGVRFGVRFGIRFGVRFGVDAGNVSGASLGSFDLLVISMFCTIRRFVF
jgi:hypothetical protein